MSFLLKILGTLIGFTTVMLACSLIVMSLVRLIQYLANSRGQTLGEMLGALNQAFRVGAHDTVSPGDAAQVAFVRDVLTYPALHTSNRLQTLAGEGLQPDKLDKRREKLAREVEYLAPKDLLSIVRAMLEPATPETPEDERLLPAHWSAILPPSRRKYGDFRQSVEAWYKTLEGTATEMFKVKAKRLTATLSCILVVVVNLDGLQLVAEIYNDAALQQTLGEQAQVVLLAADRMGNNPYAPLSDREVLLDGAPATARQMNGVLTEPGLRFGWHNSHISEKWSKCVEGGKGKNWRSCVWSFDNMSWLLGLVLSGLLLSLGAPFWADRLRDLLSLRNAIRTRAEGKKDETSSQNQPEGGGTLDASAITWTTASARRGGPEERGAQPTVVWVVQPKRRFR